jgi:glycine/D-amino acid oxidase-like deaminating enzyme
VAPLEILVTSDGRQSVIVLGGGPAGLTAAYRLAAGGCRVTLVSPSSLPGEELRRRGEPPSPILGCHHATWQLLNSLGMPRSPSWVSESTLEFLLPDGRIAHYPKTRFPTPLQQLLTIGRFAGLSASERWKLLSWLEQLWEGSLDLPSDLEHRTALHWLESLAYSGATIQSVWSPLAGWLTGNELDRLSADAFITALKPCFLSGGADSRVWTGRQTWDRLLAEPITDRLIKSGATLTFQIPVVRFEFKEDRMSGVRLRDGTVVHADWYLSAVPPSRLTPLLPERWLTRYAYFQQIADLTSLPCTTFQIRTTATLASPRQILLGSGTFRWVSCMPSSQDGTVVARVAMPSDGRLTDAEQQVSGLLRSLGLLNPRDRLTAFTQEGGRAVLLLLSPGTKVRRPIQGSPIANLLLAGAWTDTGWPPNMESAIVSGERCADIILQHRSGVR